MINMNKFFNALFYIFLGLLIIFYTIYRRILVIRLPKELYFCQNDVINYNLIILVLVSILICSYLLYKNILILLKINIPETFLSTLSLKINTIVENSLFEVYNFCGKIFVDPYDKITFISQKFYKYFKNISELLFLSMLTIIKLIIVICFIIDVFVYFRLEYMYKSLYLLCLSLIIKLLFYILNDFANNLQNAQNVLVIEYTGINLTNKLPIFSYSLKKEFNTLDLKYHVEQYILCSKLSGYLDNYNRYKTFFTPYINIIIYVLYLVGWLSVIFVNFMLV